MTAVFILAAKTFVYDEGLEFGTGAFGEELREGKAKGEVDAEGFATGEEFVVSGSEFVVYFDFHGFFEIVSFFVFVFFLGDEGDGHFVVGELAEDFVGAIFDLGDGLFNEEGGDTFFAEGFFDFFEGGNLGEDGGVLLL